MREWIAQLCEGVSKVQESGAQALLEASTEVVRDLIKAYDEYERKSEV